MFAPTAARSLAEAIIQASSYRETHGRARAAGAVALTITVSRQAGADGTAVAAEVGGRLGWPVYDRTLIERVANEMHLRTKLLDSVDERRMGWLLECAQAFGTGP